MDRAAHADERVRAWEAGIDHVEPHPSLVVPEERTRAVLDDLTDRLRENYPFSPRYAGQMLKPPHPAAVAAYRATMRITPNAHALDGGPATSRPEKEVVADLAAMFGLGPGALGHLTSSGTIANLEAPYVARHSHPGLAVAFSEQAHHTHARMCEVLGIEGIAVPADGRGRIDVDALADVLATGRVGTVVATPGTTGLGAVDQVQHVVALAREHGVRVHVDAAYGGSFTLAARREQPLVDPAPWLALAGADSIVVDPHKHGLQPYGCGAVLFADPGVDRFYLHDSPYTYFTSDELHLGEISLDRSRAGAAAVALWTTLRLLPLQLAAGLGEVVAACRRAALAFDAAVARSSVLVAYQEAELDIVTYLDRRARTTSEVDATSARVLEAGMTGADPVFVSTLSVSSADLVARHPRVRADTDQVRVLRSVLMKPEHEDAVPWLVDRLEDLAGPPPRA